MNDQSISNHIKALEAKHGELQTILDSRGVSLPDEEASELKRKKLLLKDEIAHFQNLLVESGN